MVEPNGSSSITDSDCSKLEELLKAGKWQEADHETLAIMLRATNREQEGWLDLEHIQQFPDSELNTINRLWLKYSNGHFGFSVQKSLLQKVNGQSLFWFLWEVGWLKTLSWADRSQGLIQHQAIFDITAPQGHLPICTLSNSIKRDGSGMYKVYLWSWGPRGSFNCLHGWKRDDAYNFVYKAHENCLKDLECILSRQYLE